MQICLFYSYVITTKNLVIKYDLSMEFWFLESHIVKSK